MHPLSLLLSLLLLTTLAPAAQLDTLTIPSDTLRDNPLGDPPQRRAAVLSPSGTVPSDPLPLVLYLPGWGGSAENTIAAGPRDWLATVVDRLATKGKRLRILTVDARSRYGGSQYVNSTATGRYGDYVADEIVAVAKSRYAVPERALLIAGHSSGGYGALWLAMQRQTTFAAVVALSPDSDFETTHKPLAQDPAVRALTRAELDLAMAPAKRARIPGGLAGLVVGLSANYTPRAGEPGRFDWLYDDRGVWQPAVWARWIAADPLTLIRNRADAFGPAQRIYLDGAERDEFGANIGARQMAEVLRARKAPVDFYESPGHHSQHLVERLSRGLQFALP
jgi:S-formylglutathione hydrolase FrmB